MLRRREGEMWVGKTEEFDRVKVPSTYQSDGCQEFRGSGSGLDWRSPRTSGRPGKDWELLGGLMRCRAPGAIDVSGRLTLKFRFTRGRLRRTSQ